jgi:hypothetical protein
MSVSADEVLVACPRCRSWPLSVHVLSHPRTGEAPTALVCGFCRYRSHGPDIEEPKTTKRGQSQTTNGVEPLAV